jgi:hypothetical protein
VCRYFIYLARNDSFFQTVVPVNVPPDDLANGMGETNRMLLRRTKLGVLGLAAITVAISAFVYATYFTARAEES